MRVRVAAATAHAMADGLVAVDPIVDGGGKAAGEQAIAAEADVGDASVEDEGVELGNQAVKKLSPTPGACRS